MIKLISKVQFANIKTYIGNALTCFKENESKHIIINSIIGFWIRLIESALPLYCCRNLPWYISLRL